MGIASFISIIKESNGIDVIAKPKPVSPWLNAARKIISPIKIVSSVNVRERFYNCITESKHKKKATQLSRLMN